MGRSGQFQGYTERLAGMTSHTQLTVSMCCPPVLLEVALDVVDGEPLHRHELQDALGRCLLRPLQLLHRLHEARVQLRRPAQPRLCVLPLLLRLCTDQGECLHPSGQGERGKSSSASQQGCADCSHTGIIVACKCGREKAEQWSCILYKIMQHPGPNKHCSHLLNTWGCLRSMPARSASKY